MTTAKEMKDQYNQSSSELKAKLQPMFAEKQNKRDALRVAFDKPEELAERRKLEKIKRQELNLKFKEENKDLIDKYHFLSQGNKLNEKNFQEMLKIAKGLNAEVDEDILRELIM